MANIVDTQSVDIEDPRVRNVAARVAREFELTIEKVAAHHAEPKKFPLPTAHETAEQILNQRFKALPEKTRKDVGSKSAARLKILMGPSKEVMGPSDLAGVDLSSDTPIADQVDALPLPEYLSFEASELDTLVDETSGVDALEETAATESDESDEAAAPESDTEKVVTKKLELRIHSVRCLDETGRTKIGHDEIDLGGSSVDATGTVKKIGRFRVSSNFDSGETKTYAPPRSFASFDMVKGPAFPKQYLATLVLAEIDMGGFARFLDRVYDKVHERVRKLLTKIFTAAGSDINKVAAKIATFIGKTVGVVISDIIDKIKRLWGDDIFPPATALVTIPSLTARWDGGRTDSPERTASFRAHRGKYRVTYDWRMAA